MFQPRRISQSPGRLVVADTAGASRARPGGARERAENIRRFLGLPNDGFWLFLAFQSFQRGNTGMAVLLALIGLTIALYRFGRSTRGD